jgi:ADP-dependent NAD(P)H-hydrate dehydratase / NAD(P)H-hydrate epimerase
MEPVVTSAGMRTCDRYAIDTLGIPGIVLMENAAHGIADAMEHRCGPLAGKSCLIFCGKGNNGGDGYALARHCINRGMDVTVAVVGNPAEIKGDARVNYNSLKKTVRTFGERTRCRFVDIRSAQKLLSLPDTDLIVDAIFGTGFTGSARGIQKSVIEWINASGRITISVDIPSGVNGDTGRAASGAVKADYTVTMGLLKSGLLVNEGATHSGIIDVIDIGFPWPVSAHAKSTTYLVEIGDVQRALPVRPANANKHSVGKIVVLAGSKGLTGAAALTANSAMRTGAGAVILVTPETVYPILARKCTEVMTEPAPATGAGTIAESAYEAVAVRLGWSDILVMGPGLGRHPETASFIRRIVKEYKNPLILDADGLNAFEGDIRTLSKRASEELIITPHSGELSRLTGLKASEIDENRIEVAREIAVKYRLILVLKGAPTVTAMPDGTVVINPTGNPGMATAGSGDVLSGMIGALAGQGMPPGDAAWCGGYLHGLAGDLAETEYGQKGIMATDLQNNISNAMLEAEGGKSL